MGHTADIPPAPATSRHTLLLDFDGVLSMNASGLLLRALHEGINRHTELPIEATAAQFKAICTFPQRDSLRVLFAGLGIERHLGAEIESLRSCLSVQGTRMTLARGADTFCAEQRARGVRLRVFSTMDRGTARRSLLDGLFGPEDFVPLGHASKADPDTYTALLAAENENHPERWLLVDDSPLALRAAKIAGLRTVLMRGDVFTPGDVAPFASFIDAQADSFAELGDLLRADAVAVGAAPVSFPAA
ncbi:HAD family hydrolase [Streptomyces sp. TRM49041]|uniref:HAD family hydrolase n=1 Tax=Streptomyces sp. TRM49041 TaxID=2603216 RepID=UPI0011EBE92F|nr:HAD family hydrolase [Streptomyces sp. TRM49041]